MGRGHIRQFSSFWSTMIYDITPPHSYDSCDVGTFPNQTLKDHSGPAAALHSDFSRDKYNNELSWLPGQRLRYYYACV